MTPKFQHDCPNCSFLGHFRGHDLYWCQEQRGLWTVIARYGDDGPEYKSGSAFTEVDAELAEAKRRFKERLRGEH